jgi:uncharacterized protein involved in exopolysaccharide biosynthesis
VSVRLYRSSNIRFISRPIAPGSKTKPRRIYTF